MPRSRAPLRELKNRVQDLARRPVVFSNDALPLQRAGGTPRFISLMTINHLASLRCHPRFRPLLALALSLVLPLAASRSGAAESRRAFDLPADSLEPSVKRFASQSGLEVLMPADSIGDVRTKPVRGSMTSRQALDAMLAGTGLSVFEDPRSGAFAVRRESPRPNGNGAAPKTERDRPGTKINLMALEGLQAL